MQRLEADASRSYLAQTPNVNETVDPVRIDFDAITDLLSNSSQQLCRQFEDSVEYLRKYLPSVSQGKIQFYPHKATHPVLSPSSSTSLGIPIIYLDRVYGTLRISLEPGQMTSNEFSAIHCLAERCAWILYTCEITALIQSQYQHLNANTGKDLTQKEKIVLSYLCNGKTKDEVAEILSISARTIEKHKQHIYEKLGVHNEHQVVFVAYKHNLFSPFDRGDK
jgi:DNA-binding CsgD family transcriptional regulator